MFATYQHPHASASTSSDNNYSFSHPPPLPLNAYAHQPPQSDLGKPATSTPPQAPAAPAPAPPQQQQQFTGAYVGQAGQMQPAGDISPETSAAPPAIARHQQQQHHQHQHQYSHIPQDQQFIDFQPPQQQQQQQQVDPNFVSYHQPPTQPYDYTQQQQQDFTSHHPDYQQQQLDFQNGGGSGDYSSFDHQQQQQYHQMQMMGGSEMDMNMAMGGMGMMGGVKRPRGEKISSKDFVPPDVTGMSKREARLVKNRAAAFLSRQRKREEFEAMEGRVADLEAQNAALLAQLGGAMPVGDAAHAAHIRALQARIASLEHELMGYRTAGRGHEESPPNRGGGHARHGSYDSFDSSLSGMSGRAATGATKMSDGQREAVIGMGLMALLSLSSMSPPTTKFAFAPAEHVEEPTPVTATPFNYDSIARWQERLAQTGGLATVPDEEEPKPASNPTGEAVKSEFDIAFSTTDDGRIRCHVSVPKAELGRIAQIQAAKAPLAVLNAGSYPTTPYSHAGSLHSHSSHSSQSSLSLHGNGSSLSLPLGNTSSPESLPPSHPGSASSFHTTFEAAGYQVSSNTLGVPEEQWVAQHALYAPQPQSSVVDGGLQLQAGGLGLSHSQEWAGATPIAPHPPSALPTAVAAVVKQEPAEPVRKQLGPTRRVKVALKASNGRGEWEVEVC